MPRHIFFVPGFERRSVRHHRLFQRREAMRWAARTHIRLDVEPAGETVGCIGQWTLKTPTQSTQFHVFDWSDIVGGRLKAPTHQVFAQSLVLWVLALGNGIFGKTRRRDWGIGGILALGFAPIATTVILWSLALLLFSPSMALVAGGASLVYWAMIAAGPSSPVRYVLDIAWGARRLALRDHPELEARQAELARQIRDAEGEILIVGHSLGAMIAARAAAASRYPVTLLTIGQSIPLVTLQRRAQEARNDVGAVRGPWFDISAGRDLLGFDGYDPSGGTARCIGAGLGRLVSEDRLRAMRWTGYATHFVYFEAGSRDTDGWDWNAVLAGTLRLEDLAARAPQKSGLGTRRFFI